MKLTLVQAPCSQPDTNAVMLQYLHTVGKEISTVRLRRTEHRDHSGQRSLSAGARVNGLGGESDGIDADHWAKSRIKRAQPSGSAAGHFSVMDLSPRGSEMITISSVARLGAGFTEPKAGSVAGD